MERETSAGLRIVGPRREYLPYTFPKRDSAACGENYCDYPITTAYERERGGYDGIPGSMPDPKSLPTPVLLHIAQTLNIPLKALVATIGLLDEGGTVPFIARYRKEATGNLDEIQIRAIQEKLEYFRELENRRETVLATIQE